MCLSPHHLRTETEPVSETLFSLRSLEYRMIDKIQKPINPRRSGVKRNIRNDMERLKQRLAI
jgi:hypothetical protein